MRLYTRFNGGATEMWFYGAGVAEVAIIMQCGDSFLTLVDSSLDPCLGKVVVSAGTSLTAYMVPHGDLNLRWHWNTDDLKTPNIMDRYDLHLCTSHSMLDEFRDKGYPCTLFTLGVGRFFKPLQLKRRGYGYSGLKDIHHPDELPIVLGPFMDDPLMELKLLETGDPILGLPEYNRWLNTKQIVFSMLAQKYSVVSNRPFEALASGTPLIMSRNPCNGPTFGFSYPYQTSSVEETLEHKESILDDFDATLKEFKDISDFIREKHSYDVKLRSLFKVLEDA